MGEEYSEEYVDFDWLPDVKGKDEVELRNKDLEWRRKNGIIG